MGFAEIEMVRDYLLDKNIIKRQKLNKFNINRQKLENELEYESKNIFTILNIKLSKRLLFYILLRDNIKLSEIENIYVDTNNISYNYEVLGLEYYFNCENNIFNESLLENIRNFFIKLLNDNSRKLFDNKWIKLYLQQIENINNYQNEFNLSDLNIINLYNEKKLLDKYYLSTNILCDKFLFLSEFILKKDKNGFFVEYYFNIINKLLINLINNSYDNFECSILLKIINISLEHSRKKIIMNKNNEIIKKFNIPKNIDDIMKKLIKINIDEYFPDNNHRRVEDLFIRDNTRKKMSIKIAFILEFIFKYFDLCLLLLYNENQTKFVNYMINPENNLFKYYIS